MVDFRVCLEDNDNLLLTICRDATEGLILLTQKIYDAIVVDLRIPPGDDPAFNHISETHYNNGRVFQKLGVPLISRVLQDPSVRFENKDVNKIGVFSIEPRKEFNELLSKFEINERFNPNNYLFKNDAQMPHQFESFIMNRLLH